jgi:hypothetical protein
MSSESVCQVARSWVDMGRFHTRLFGIVYFTIASVREFLGTFSYLLGDKADRCVGLTTLSPSRADCLEISGPVQTCNGVVLPFT